MKNLPNLHPLRFVLATLVMLFHVPLLSESQGLPFFNDLPIFRRGSEAVYMFFALSGFLIIRLIYIAKEHGTFSIKNFYMRRVLRILPLYYLIVVFGFCFYQLLLPQLGIAYENNYDLTEGIFLTVFFLPNIFSKYEPGGILEILWSIGIEEQFYLLIAPLLWLLRKSYVLWTLIVLLVGYFVIFHLPGTPFLRKYQFVYFFMIAGGVTAVLAEKNCLNVFKNHKLIPLLVVLFTLLYFTTDILKFNDRLINNLIPCLLFPLFVYSISMANGSWEIKSRLLNHLGKISYGIYMYHAIAMNLVVFVFLKLTPKSNWPDYLTIISINLATFIVTLVMAHLSYTYFESYFLRLKDKYRRKAH